MGRKNHLTTLAAPKSWLIERKGNKWTIKPSAGPHKITESMPLALILKQIIGCADTTKEAKRVVKEGKILVDKKMIKDYRFPVGLMDVLEIPLLKEAYRVLYDKKGRLFLYRITNQDEMNMKPCKIIGKTIISGNKTQVNLYDGRNRVLDGKEKYSVGDTLVIDIVKNQIKDHLRFDKGAVIYLVGGKHAGSIGILEDVHKFQGSQPDKIILKIEDNKIETLKDYAFVIGKDNPVISLPDKK